MTKTISVCVRVCMGGERRGCDAMNLKTCGGFILRGGVEAIEPVMAHFSRMLVGSKSRVDLVQ